MLELDLPELEQEFRQSWRGYDVSRYESFLSRVTPANRLELLTRLLSTELDFFYQRPPAEDAPQTEDEDDDERVSPRVQLFVLRFPDLRNEPGVHPSLGRTRVRAQAQVRRRSAECRFILGSVPHPCSRANDPLAGVDRK